MHLTRPRSDKGRNKRRQILKRDMDSDDDSSSSDMDSLTEDLDQIGRLNFPAFSTYLSKEHLPSLASLPHLPALPNLPTLPNLPNLGSLPNLPNLPNLPTFDLTEVSKYISKYINNATLRFKNEPAAEETKVINMMKTAIATRIQMTSFLSDLKGGLTLQAAIDRLQPLTDVIHEAIMLPADDVESEDETEVTEPVGVGQIVNREQPLIAELILPEEEPLGHKRRHRHKSRKNDPLSNLEDVEELTAEEARALTHLDSLDDFLKEDLLRTKIQKIQGLESLSQELKNKLVTRLMMGNYYKYMNLTKKESDAKGKKGKDEGKIPPQTNIGEPELLSAESFPEKEESLAEHNNDEVVLTEADQCPSYHSPGILGCSHYQRNCKLECPTCLKWFPCRFCHDLVSDHKLQRTSVRHILCMRCNVPQVPESNYCVNCDDELAYYFCPKCVLYDNDQSKDIYHCDKCGICRLGLGLSKDYFHCDECNICLAIDLKEHHRCVTNTTHCNCPICNEYLFTSVAKVVFMTCGHLIHQACYDEMVKHSYKCPMCKKTVVNAETQFRILDQEIRQLPLPPPYDTWRCVVKCNDCGGKSSCPYHVLGLKCKYCQSYNTTQLKVVKPEEEDVPETVDMATENQRIASFRLVPTTLSSNFLIDEQNSTEVFSAEDSDLEDDEQMVTFRRLTHALVGSGEEETRTLMSAMFQNFINQVPRPGSEVHGQKGRADGERECDKTESKASP